MTDQPSIEKNTEVNQEQAAPDVAPSEQPPENQPPENIPYERFQEVNTQKNDLKDYKTSNEDYKAKFETLQSDVQTYISNNNLETQPEQSPAQFETTDELIKHNEKQIDSKIAPILKMQKDLIFGAQIDSFFAQDQEAAKIKQEMDSYTAKMTPVKKAFLKESVVNGDLSVLQEIKALVTMKNNNNLASMENEQRQQEVDQTFTPQRGRAVKNMPSTFENLIAKGKENGNFDNVFQSMAQSVT